MNLPGEKDIERIFSQAWREYQSNDSTIDDLYNMMMPFGLRICSRVCGKYIEETDDEASIARLAFLEAMETYDPERGSIVFYLGQVIRSRIVDYKRKEKKHRMVSFSLLSGREKVSEEPADDGFFEEIIEDMARKQEIEQLKALLAAFDITFLDLSQVSPRQTKTREQAKEIACWISNDSEMLTYLMERKMIPIRALESNWQASRKLVDRYRKYIIAAVLIHAYDLSCLKPYVLPAQRREH